MNDKPEIPRGWRRLRTGTIIHDGDKFAGVKTPWVTTQEAGLKVLWGCAYIRCIAQLSSTKKLRNSVNRARGKAAWMDSSSRHVHLMAEALVAHGNYPMFDEDPEHCAKSLLAVLKMLWISRKRPNPSRAP